MRASLSPPLPHDQGDRWPGLDDRLRPGRRPRSDQAGSPNGLRLLRTTQWESNRWVIAPGAPQAEALYMARHRSGIPPVGRPGASRNRRAGRRR